MANFIKRNGLTRCSVCGNKCDPTPGREGDCCNTCREDGEREKGGNRKERRNGREFDSINLDGLDWRKAMTT